MEYPRVERTKRHKLIDIIAITVAAIICGCEDWEEIELFGKSKKEWLKTFLELPHVIPSYDTFNRVFAGLDTAMLQQCLLDWIQQIATITEYLISVNNHLLFFRQHTVAIYYFSN